MSEIKKQSKVAIQKYNMLVIPGIEFSNYVQNQHVVCLDIKKYVRPEADLEKSLIESKKQNVLLIGAHPWKSKSKVGGELWKDKEVTKLLDIWEVGNGTDYFPHVSSNGYRVIGVTDFHGKKNHGILGWKTLIESDKNIESIKTAILNQKIFLYDYKE